MFVYRHFGRWGFGIGSLPFLFIILPAWIVWEATKALVLVLWVTLSETGKVIRWAWRQRHDPSNDPDPGNW